MSLRELQTVKSAWGCLLRVGDFDCGKVVILGKMEKVNSAQNRSLVRTRCLHGALLGQVDKLAIFTVVGRLSKMAGTIETRHHSHRRNRMGCLLLELAVWDVSIFNRPTNVPLELVIFSIVSQFPILLFFLYSLWDVGTIENEKVCIGEKVKKKFGQGSGRKYFPWRSSTPPNVTAPIHNDQRLQISRVRIF